MSEDRERFAVFAEAEGFENPLIVTNLTFARLMDDLVVPFEGKKKFMIDGAPLDRTKVKRIKIIQQSSAFEMDFSLLHVNIRGGSLPVQKSLLENYHLRLEAMLRESGDDVTSQVLQAFDTKIRPSLKEYLPKREELIRLAMEFFFQSLKALGSLS